MPMPGSVVNDDFLEDVETTPEQKRLAALFAARHVPRDSLVGVLGMLGVLEALRPAPEPVSVAVESIAVPEPVDSAPEPAVARFPWAVAPSWNRKFPWARRRGSTDD